MVRLKSKEAKPRFNVDEPTSSGGENTSSERPFSPLEEGDTSDNARGVIRVSDDPNIQLLRETLTVQQWEWDA